MGKCTVVLLVVLASCAYSRDFYMGMFKPGDFLVASDTLFKEKRPFQRQVEKYGRLFHCPITYFRVIDRLNLGSGPGVQIIRGGLQNRYIVAKITGSYNLPISINVLVGCTNFATPFVNKTTTSTTTGEHSSPTSNGKQSSPTSNGEQSSPTSNVEQSSPTSNGEQSSLTTTQ